jgi:hypothetical protein
MKQETLEEAAERLYQKGLKDDLSLSFHDGVNFVAKWQAEIMGLMEIELRHTKTLLASCEKALEDRDNQAERMYSGEELRKAIKLARLCTLDNVTGEFVDLSGLTEVCTYGLEETHSEDSIIEQFKKK